MFDLISIRIGSEGATYSSQGQNCYITVVYKRTLGDQFLSLFRSAPSASCIDLHYIENTSTLKVLRKRSIGYV